MFVNRAKMMSRSSSITEGAVRPLIHVDGSMNSQADHE
jgi:hypothetical protein